MEMRTSVKIITASILTCAIFNLTGCDSMTKQDVGTMTGAVAGGLVGSTIGKGGGQILAIGAGAVAGAYLGNMIGKNMDETDKLKTQMAIEQNKSNQSTNWVNPDTGTRYSVTPKRTYKKANQYCREYTMTATIDGKQQKTYGTACRQPDGGWKVKS